jgi:hypothetical protein
MVARRSARQSRLIEALDRGLVAGWRGTAAMTMSSTAEAKLSGRGPSTTPAAAAGKVGGVVPRDEAGERWFNTLAHWGDGTAWGLFRATLVHLTVMLGAEQAVPPAPGVPKPMPYYGIKAVGTDTVHNAVYVGVSGLVYDCL